MLGLVIALTDYEPVEMIPDFEGLVEVWIACIQESENQFMIFLIICPRFFAVLVPVFNCILAERPMRSISATGILAHVPVAKIPKTFLR